VPVLSVSLHERPGGIRATVEHAVLASHGGYPGRVIGQCRIDDTHFERATDAPVPPLARLRALAPWRMAVLAVVAVVVLLVWPW
jgi:hypothetical protein